MINVILVEPQALFRAAIKHLLFSYSTIRLTSTFERGEAISSANMDISEGVIIILSTNIYDVSLISLIKKLKRYIPRIKLLVLSNEENLNLAEQYRMAGADGYIARTVTEEQFIEVLTRIWQNGSVWPDNLVQHLKQNRLLFDMLSEKEMEVLIYLLKGESIKVISNILCLSPKTISTYKGRIFKKMGMNSMMDVFLLGTESGLIKLKNAITMSATAN